MSKITQNTKKNQSNKKVVKVKTEMTGKGLTTYAGVMPVLNFMKKLNLRNKTRNEVSINRASNAVYQFADIIEMIIVGLFCGATSIDQVTLICKDNVVSRIAGWKKVPAATTVSRILSLVTFGNVVGLEVLIHKLRGRVWKCLVRSGNKLICSLSSDVMWLDVDSTVEGVCGNQEGAEKGYNPNKKGQKSYNPQMAFVSATKEVLHSWFRCGSAYTSNGIVEFMKECMSRINNGVKVIFRGDSGYFSGKLFEYLESVGAGYLVKVKLKNLVSLLSRQTWTSVIKHPGWEETVFYYQCSGWSHARKFVAVRRLIRIEKGLIDIPIYDYFCYATTESLSPMQTHRKYGERATCETWIEECKTQMRAGNIRTSDFLSNAALFQCAVLAYNIFRWMALLTGGEISKWEVKTIRFNLIRLAGKLVAGSRQLILKLPKYFIHKDKWIQWEQMSLTVSLY